MTLFTAFATIAALGLLAFIRLAPSDPAIWHISPVTSSEAGQGPCAAAIITQPNGARAACLSPDTPESLLAKLDATALAPPRTTRLAGTPQTGRITWITRTAWVGYPDYTTAEATLTPTGTRLDLYARQRFGGADFGVNTARLKSWLKDF